MVSRRRRLLLGCGISIVGALLSGCNGGDAPQDGVDPRPLAVFRSQLDFAGQPLVELELDEYPDRLAQKISNVSGIPLRSVSYAGLTFGRRTGYPNDLIRLMSGTVTNLGADEVRQLKTIDGPFDIYNTHFVMTGLSATGMQPNRFAGLYSGTFDVTYADATSDNGPINGWVDVDGRVLLYGLLPAHRHPPPFKIDGIVGAVTAGTGAFSGWGIGNGGVKLARLATPLAKPFRLSAQTLTASLDVRRTPPFRLARRIDLDLTVQPETPQP